MMNTIEKPMSFPCPHCGRLLQTLTAQLSAFPLPAEVAALPIACDCPATLEAERRAAEKVQAQREAAALKARLRAACLPERFAAVRFRDALRDTVALQAAYQFAADWCRDWVAGTPRKAGLYIAGGVGAGKSHLAACCANYLLRKKMWVTWRSFGGILSELRSSYGLAASEEARLVSLYGRKAAVLVLDDLGKQKPTEWALERLFTIVDLRYSANLPMIITTNYGGDDLMARMTPRDSQGDSTTARAIVERLCELSLDVVLDGPSFRTRRGSSVSLLVRGWGKLS